MFNQISIEGRFVKDPTSRTLPSGLTIANATIACDRSIKKDNKPTLFIAVTFFGAQAENVCKYFHKGSAIIVTGRLENDIIENKDAPGTNKTVYYINATAFDFPIGSAKKDQDEPQREQEQTQQKQYPPHMNGSNLEAIDVIEDDLPF